MREYAIEFTNVSKMFGKKDGAGIHDLNFSVNAGEFITILGSSGCGKTTLLKMVNKLYEADSGEIRIFNQNIDDINEIELRRKMGYVIQQIGLFPHMTIKKNILLLPSVMKMDQVEVEKKMNELLALVNLDPQKFLNRYPSQLSGGQQQRIGLVRALIANPDILLLDEPFGALDAITRLNLQKEMKKLHEQLHKTILFVTHDIYEALYLGNRVMIMEEGKIVQFDFPGNIIKNPATPFVEMLISSTKEQERFWSE